jgi:hypothetical protein
MLELLYTSTKSIDLTVFNWTPSHMGYVAAWDALVCFIYNSLHKVFRDGTQAYLGGTNGYWTKGNRYGGRFFYYQYASDPAWCYAADEITGQLHTDQVLNPGWRAPVMGGAYLDDVNQLFLTTESPVKIRRLSDGSQVGEIAFGFIPNNLIYAGPRLVLAVKHNPGQVALLDYISQTVIWKSTMRPCISSAYDSRHQLVITLESDRKIRLYLLDPVPTTLTAPVLTPGAMRGSGSKVKVRLTGDAGEPCAGYVVRWEIAGVPPQGSLFKAATVTGDDGYAENFYFSPGQGEVLGQETIKATVVV